MANIRVTSDSGWGLDNPGDQCPRTFLTVWHAKNDLRLQKTDTKLQVRATRPIWRSSGLLALVFIYMLVVAIRHLMDDMTGGMLVLLFLAICALLLLGYTAFCPRSVEFHTDSASLVYRIGGLRQFSKEFRLRSDSELVLLEFWWAGSGGSDGPSELRPVKGKYKDLAAQMFIPCILQSTEKAIYPFVTESEDMAEQFIAEVELSLESLVDGGAVPAGR